MSEIRDTCLTVGEAARILRLSPGQIRRMIQHGRLRAADVGLDGRHCWRIPADALSELLRAPAQTVRS